MSAATITKSRANEVAKVEAVVLSDPRLTPAERLVYMILKSYRNNRTGKATVNRNTLADDLSLHPASVSRMTTKLCELGYLERETDGRGGRRCTVYTFPLTKANAENDR